MRLTTFGVLIAALASSAGSEYNAPLEDTTIAGVVRKAGSAEPIANAAVFTGGSDSVLTDSAGRFVARVSRSASLLGVRKNGYLAFEYPLLHLTTDTLHTEIDLRTDPPGPESHATATNLFLLCIIADAPDRLVVRNHCGSTPFPAAEYTRRIIKHNPWNQYFGPVGDKGGVQLMTRVVAAPST